MKWKLLTNLAFIIALSAAFFIGYGVKTQCENVAVYVFCGEK